MSGSHHGSRGRHGHAQQRASRGRHGHAQQRASHGRAYARALLGAWLLLLFAAASTAAAPPPGAPEPGPPYPPPLENVVVYDYAGIFSSETVASATRTITAIEERVRAEMVVYTQLKPGSDAGSTEADAAQLIDQWGVGRAGFDDGVAILFNMTRETCRPGVPGNGQVQLFAGPGYRATFLSDAERQAIFDNDMLPLLRECEFDDALLIALAKIDANATADHARTLEFARIANAAVGLIGAPVLFLLLAGAAARSWLLYGRDPVYLDSPSILMPAPPPDLTAASGAVVWEGKTTTRALTTALLDLASRGELNFRTERKLLTEKAGIQLAGGEATDPYVVRNRRRPLSKAEDYALTQLRTLAATEADLYIEPEELVGFAPRIASFNTKLESHVAKQGWFREPPAKATSRWRNRGVIAIVAGVVSLFVADAVPSGGLTLLAIAVVAAGIVIVLVSRVMPARTMAGAMIYAMLAAYRRTLQKTMAQARSMQEVVDQAQLEWLETPDQAVVWGVALGLHGEVEEVLQRSVEDTEAGVTAHNPWVPSWYGRAGSQGLASAGAGPRGFAPGLFSSSAMPNFGGMMSALGSIGASSSGSGSGGFSGGSSGGGGGGGGGGAGGGF